MSQKSPQIAFRLGILGGGQLGWMLLPSAKHHHVTARVLDTNPTSCKGVVEVISGDPQNRQAVLDFAQDLHALTVEREWVDAGALKELEEKGLRVYPSSEVLGLIQNKISQKQFFKSHDIPTAPFSILSRPEDVSSLNSSHKWILKMPRGGYDGKGVALWDTQDPLPEGFHFPLLVESLVEIDKEVSIIVARNHQGEIQTFDPVEMVFDEKLHLLDYLKSPASLDASTLQQAKEIACLIASQIHLIGILAIEFFYTQDGRWLVNEMAPRPHNSGHHTLEACESSQYDALMRILTHQSFGNSSLRKPALMFNLVGDFDGPCELQIDPKIKDLKEVKVYWYRKTHSQKGRKLGHVTILGSLEKELLEKMEKIKSWLKIIPS